MKGTRPKQYILLIDDDVEALGQLKKELAKVLKPPNVPIRSWVPKILEGNVADKFKTKLGRNTVLVATDYDLTGGGMKGLFGHTIVRWCQQQAIPVGNFSRANTARLPDKPSLFELQIPADDEKGAQCIASAFHGFRELRRKIDSNRHLLDSKRSLAAVLAELLDRPHLDSEFALYMSRFGTSNAALVQQLSKFATDQQPNEHDKTRLVSYMLGHILLNAILRFPGPILSLRVLCAYVATSEKLMSREEVSALQVLFEKAEYNGPFSEGNKFYWREEVNTVLYEHESQARVQGCESFDTYNRAVVEYALNRKLTPHDCQRCRGNRGGFLCPFTERTVCQQADCSVVTSSWIPQGAQLCRIERDFFDEWAPILGF